MTGATRMQGFSTDEHRARVARAQTLMAGDGLAALLLTTEPEIRYFSGFLTRFWESPTRPWFLIVPASGDPVAVIPAIGAPLMARGWLDDIRTWRSPAPEDEGVSLLADTLRERVGASGRIGVPMGPETHLRMPLADWARLRDAAAGLEFCGDGGIMTGLRMRKSAAEIDKIAAACAVADRAFARVPEIVRPGVALDTVFREFQVLCLREGADWVPYLAGACAPGGYSDVISPAGPEPVETGDILMLDTGVMRDGYFCDFDRNFAIGAPAQAVRDAHARLIEAVDAAAAIARPGITASDLFHAMDRIVTGGAGGSDAGRLGHGLGMQLTEAPSLTADDRTVIEAGMVLTLEPGIEVTPGRWMVHEENIVIGRDKTTFLSTRRGPEIAVIGGGA